MAPHKALWLLDSGGPSGMNPGTLSRNSTLCAFKRNPSVHRLRAVCPPRTGNTRTGNTVPIVGEFTGSWRKPTNRKLLSIEKITEIQKTKRAPIPCHSKCGPGSRGATTSGTWELVRNADSQVPSDLLNQSLHFNKSQVSCVYSQV